MQVWQLILCGLFVHLVLLNSIFDIYFTSPLVHGMTPQTSASLPPAKRLVLFVADGLRADRFFETGEDGRSRAPYLRNVMETQGSWGVSHTHLPTESRQGHVALISGYYEDIIGVVKGWTENPVEFDSVFNESRYTWSWGSPDILQMFAKGASGNHVYTDCYLSSEEDYVSADSSELDSWVFEKIKEFISSARSNATLTHQLQQDRTVFFLHLLGTDTNGHSHKPHSREYTENIRLLDKGIQDTVSLLEDFFHQDNQTAYIMSSDHGMSDGGFHGDGQPTETRTPLVAWGAGIHGPRRASICGQYEDTLCTDWNLNMLTRFDVEQADIASLMSYLIGVAFPMNSVGVLPLYFLDASLREQAEGIYANAQQILAQYQVKMNEVKERRISFTFSPFSELSPSIQTYYVRHIQQLIYEGKYKEVISQCRKLVQMSIKGLNYYQKYDGLFLWLNVVLGFVGWMAYVLQHVLRGSAWITDISSDTSPSPHQKYVMAVTIGLGILIVLLLFSAVFLQAGIVVDRAGLYIPLVNHFKSPCYIKVWGWFLSCALVAVFPMMPVVGSSTSYRLVFVSGVFAFLLGTVVMYRLGTLRIHDTRSNRNYYTITSLQLVMILVATVVVQTTSDGVAAKRGVSDKIHVLSWSVLDVSLFWQLMTSTNVAERLASVGLSFICPYILMSITGMILISPPMSSSPIRNIDPGPADDCCFRMYDEHSSLQVLLTVTAFFGSGNMASINSFDNASVYCFLTVFDPFVMGGLMLFKITIPLLLITCAFRAVHIVTNIPPPALFPVVIIMMDFMALRFFLLVRDDCSWSEMGAAFSHYLVIMMMVAFIMVLMGISHVLTCCRLSFIIQKHHPL